MGILQARGGKKAENPYSQPNLPNRSTPAVQMRPKHLNRRFIEKEKKAGKKTRTGNQAGNSQRKREQLKSKTRQKKITMPS